MTDFYIRVPTDLSDYTCEQTIISKKKYLKHLKRVNYEDDCICPIPQTIDWYPFTNSYYPHTEDVDAIARVNHLLGSKPSFQSLTSVPNCDTYYEGDAYSEKGAQLQYLSSNPISFIILGKPGIGEQELGKLLADHWKCVYIDPETLIREEIASGTRAGQCIEFNLRSGRAIGVDVILKLVEKRVNSKSSQHRGFVINGFPMIPNDLYEEDPVSSESAVFNVKDIFEDIFDTTIEIGVPPPDKPKVSIASVKGEGDVEEEETKSEASPGKSSKLPDDKDDVPIDIGSTTSTICRAGDYEKDFEEQINFIFSQLHRPFMIIYITCSNSDVVSKHSDCRFDFLSKEIVDLQREYSDKVVYTFFSRVPGASNDEIPDDFIDVVKNTTMTYDSARPRELLLLPRDFPANMLTLLDRYRYYALPIIERHVLVHDSQYYMKVDGRISPVRMFNAVKTRLRVLPLQQVVLVEKMMTAEVSGEGGPVEDIVPEELTLEEHFELFRKKNIASTMFKWGWSDWGVKCPVSMYEGEYKDGDPKFAVHFMNKIYFISDEAAYWKFYRNPRLYLLPPYPKPSGRIFVIGPQCSGKSTVAKCLGYLLKTEVLEYDLMVKNFKKHRQAAQEEKVRSAALIEGVSLLNEKRKSERVEQEAERQIRVDSWVEEQKALLAEAVKFKEHVVEDEEEVSLAMDISSFPMQISYHRKSHALTLKGSDTSLTHMEYMEKIQKTIAGLEALFHISGLPGLDEIALCEQILAEPETLMNYLPPELLPPTIDVEPATVFDDFVQHFVEKVVLNTEFDDVELTLEEQTDMLIERIGAAEAKNLDLGLNKGGWIIDGIPIKPELFERVFANYIPDDIFVLRDTAEGFQFLLQRFEAKGQNEYREFRRFFMDVHKPDAAWRSPSLRSTISYKSRLAGDILADVVDESFFIAEKTAAEEQSANEVQHPQKAALEAYHKTLQQFDTDIELIYTFLSEFKITITELVVTDKSFDDLLKEVVYNIDNRFRQLASLFTEQDRLQEVEDFGEPEMHGEDEGEGEEKAEGEDLFAQNRRFGDTFNYCPVTYHNHWVLWKGKEEYAAKFENKIYFMCKEDAMNAFILEPRKYLLQTEAPKLLPPPRICIVGPRGSGKTTVTKSLCENLGLYNMNYDQLIKTGIAPKSKFELAEILKMGIAEPQGEMILNYLATDEPLPHDFLTKIILPIWSTDPVKLFGFIFDGFPRRPSDTEYMIEHATIPDIVVELSITAGEIEKRLIEKFVKDWHDALNKKQELLEKKRGEMLLVWQEKRTMRFQELMEIKKEERYLAKVQELQGAEKNDQESPKRPYMEDLREAEEETEPSTVRTNKSLISYDSVAEEADIEAVNAIIDQELPEIVFEDEPEEPLEEVLQRYINELQESYGNEMGFLRIIRERCEAELIPWITVDGGMTTDKVFAQIMRVVDKYKFRNNSLFERVYDISVDLADKLLSKGYYFLSKFGKTCPVQMYENINPVQMFLPLEKKFQLYPVIHRTYIYFLAGLENRNKFKEHPLQFISLKNCDFPLIPLKLAIIGPPKSGKTTLAQRFHRDLGMKVISQGQAGRYVLKYLAFSELANNMESVLRLGWELTSEMSMKAIAAMTFDGKSVTQGFVLDGLPETIEEVRHLAQLGLVPHLVINLQAEYADIYEFRENDVGKRDLPVFSMKFIDHRYKVWLETTEEFCQWLDTEYQILAKIPVKPSKWGVLTASYELATAVFSEIKHYYKHAYKDMALRLANMQVTPLEFVERRGAYKNYCPCCLHHDNALLCGGDPPDRTGLVQFRKSYYYLCPVHIDEFITEPELYLSPYNNHSLPPYLPKRVYLTQIPENVHQEGVCIICYWINQPNRVVRKGDPDYAVLYREKVYLFDCPSCVTLFMKYPHKYFAKVINFKGLPYPSLEYQQLPTLGLLQQYDARQLTKAIINTSVIRPIIAGLSISISAILNVGLYLKVHNPKTPEAFLPLHQTALNKFHERRLNLIDYLAKMKRSLNPYLYYDEPMPKFVDPLFPAPALATIMAPNDKLGADSELDMASPYGMGSGDSSSDP